MKVIESGYLEKFLDSSRVVSGFKSLPEIKISLLEGVYRPKTDSFLTGVVLSEMDVKGKRVADICTGSGIQALILAKKGAKTVLATDISENAVICAELNAKLNNVVIKTALGDLLEPLSGMRKFDIIVSNPPSLPRPPDKLLVDEGYLGAKVSISDTGPDGRRYIDSLITQVPKYLKKGGYFVILHASFCDIEQTIALLAGQGFLVSTRTSSYPLGKSSSKLLDYFLSSLPRKCHPYKRDDVWYHDLAVFKAYKSRE
jgi:release factor glutamine methyltransferase